MPTGSTNATPRHRRPRPSRRRCHALDRLGDDHGREQPDGHDHLLPVRAGRDAQRNDSNNVYTNVVTVNGAGTYPTAMGTNPGGFKPTATGTYEWVAVYSGDTNNPGVTSPFGSEPEVSGPLVSISTTPGGPVIINSISSGTDLTDSATLSGGYNTGRHAHLLPVRAGRDARPATTATTSTPTRCTVNGDGDLHHGHGHQPGRLLCRRRLGNLSVGGRLQRRQQQRRARSAPFGSRAARTSTAARRTCRSTKTADQVEHRWRADGRLHGHDHQQRHGHRQRPDA